jgi:hypothetical protein
MVTPLIEKQDTCIRQAVSPHEILTATLRLLATGRTYEDLKFTPIMPPQVLSKIIPETYRSIFKSAEETIQLRHDLRLCQLLSLR